MIAMRSSPINNLKIWFQFEVFLSMKKRTLKREHLTVNVGERRWAPIERFSLNRFHLMIKAAHW